MSVNSIATGSMVLQQVQSLVSAAAASKHVKGAPATQDMARAASSGANDQNAGNKLSADTAPSSVVAPKNTGEPAGVVNHVVVSYNQQGKLRTKFEDSRNNVVYQMPSEAAAKLEDQIAASNKFADVKG